MGKSYLISGVIQPDQPPDLAIRNLISLLSRFPENPTGGVTYPDYPVHPTICSQ
jgi:hypothetical protein